MGKEPGDDSAYGYREIQLYNEKRPHTALADRTPEEFARALGGRPFAFQIVGKADPRLYQGSAVAGQKPPALDTAADLPWETERKAKGLSERLLLERFN